MQEQEQDGEHGEDAANKRPAQIGILDLREEDRQRIFQPVFQEDKRLFDHVPGIDEVQDDEGGNPRFGLRNHHKQKRFELIRPVQPCRFQNGIRDRLEGLRQQEHAERRADARQDDRRIRPDHTELVQHDVVRDKCHLKREHHQKHHQREQQILPGVLELRKSVPAETGEQGLSRRDRRAKAEG